MQEHNIGRHLKQYDCNPLSQPRNIVFADGSRLVLPQGTNYIAYEFCDGLSDILVYVRRHPEGGAHGRLSKAMLGELEAKLKAIDHIRERPTG